MVTQKSKAVVATPVVVPAVQATPFNTPNGKPAAIPVSNAKSAVIPPHLQSKPAAKKLVAVKIERKETLATVRAMSSKQETEKTIPFVLMRRGKQGAKATRSIVNFIQVADTKEASHVRAIRIAIVNGEAYGTNYNVPNSGITDVRKARFFVYSDFHLGNKTAKKAQPWDFANEDVVRALEKLSVISKYDLEFHLAETKRRSEYEVAIKASQAKKVAEASDLAALKQLAKRISKSAGNVVLRSALRSVVPGIF